MIRISGRTETGRSSTHSLEKGGYHQHILWRNGDIINTLSGRMETGTSSTHSLNECLSAIFIEPGFFYFLYREVSYVFFVLASRWFRVFHRGCYVYFPIVFSSNSYIFSIYLYFFHIFSLYSGFFDLCWVISLGCRPRIDRPAHTLYIIYRIV